MALDLDKIRALAERIAASYQLEIVETEFSGGTKFRTLRVFVEKNIEARHKLAELAASTEENELPKGVPAEMLSGVTHEDCANFARDFGTVIDIEDLIPGSEYTLEVSSPGLERKLMKAADYLRFIGSLVKLQTFTAIEKNRHFQGRLTGFKDEVVTLDLGALKQKGKSRKALSAEQVVHIPFANVEKANLLLEI